MVWHFPGPGCKRRKANSSWGGPTTRPEWPPAGQRWDLVVRGSPHRNPLLEREGKNNTKKKIVISQRQKQAPSKIHLPSPPSPASGQEISSGIIRKLIGLRNSDGGKQCSRGPTEPRYLAEVTNGHAFRVTEKQNVSKDHCPVTAPYAA